MDLNTGTLRFRAKIDNPADAHGNRFIVPGLFVRVRLPIGEPHPALMVREQALVTDQGRKTVYVVKEKKDEKGTTVKDEKGEPTYIAMVRDVGTVGVLRDGYREVEKGIEPGDWVVVAGMQRLRPGIEVKVEKYDERAARTKEPARRARRREGGLGRPRGGQGSRRIGGQGQNAPHRSRHPPQPSPDAAGPNGRRAHGDAAARPGRVRPDAKEPVEPVMFSARKVGAAH